MQCVVSQQPTSSMDKAMMSSIYKAMVCRNLETKMCGIHEDMMCGIWQSSIAIHAADEWGLAQLTSGNCWAGRALGLVSSASFALISRQTSLAND